MFLHVTPEASDSEDQRLKTSNSEDRRLKYERRQYSYADHIPERRSGEDRRDEIDTADPENSEQ